MRDEREAFGERLRSSNSLSSTAGSSGPGTTTFPRATLIAISHADAALTKTTSASATDRRATSSIRVLVGFSLAVAELFEER